MIKTLEQLGIKFGRKHIALNGNFYRVSRPTKEFWDWYKENKEAMKNAGYSVYKHKDYGFCVYDWTEKRKATQEEYDEYKKEEKEWEEKRIRMAWEQIVADVDERGAYGETVKDCETWDDIWSEVERLYENPKYAMEDILLNIPCSFYFS